METLPITLTQLRGMIGLTFRWHGGCYVVIEMLEDGPSLVAQSVTPTSSIQGDVHGRARREVRDVLVIPVLAADKSLLHPDFLDIDLC